MRDQRTKRILDEQAEPSAGRVPPLLRFLGLHLALGAAIATAFVSLIILIDLGGLKRLLVTAQDPIVPLLLLYGFNVITFSSVAMGIGIMTMPLDAPEAADEAHGHAPARTLARENARSPELEPAARRATELSSNRSRSPAP